MNEITFEWDEQKALTNERKHGIAFAEAESVFYVLSTVNRGNRDSLSKPD